MKKDFTFKKGVYIFSCDGLNPRGYLEKAGYKRHRYIDEYILERPKRCRFHAYIEDFKVHLHYDDVRPDGWKHYVRRNPRHMMEVEMHRILKIFRPK